MIAFFYSDLLHCCYLLFFHYCYFSVRNTSYVAVLKMIQNIEKKNDEENIREVSVNIPVFNNMFLKSAIIDSETGGL